MKQLVALTIVGLALVIGVNLAADSSDETASAVSRNARKPARPIDVAAGMVEIEVQIVETTAGSQQDKQLGFAGSTDETLARVRELERQGKLDVVNRIRLATLDQQPAFVQVGERRPVVTAWHSTGRPSDSRAVNSMTYQNVGTILGVTPRIAGSDVIMELDIEKSRLDDTRSAGARQDDDTAFVPPRIVTANCQTTIRVAGGKTVIVGGMQTQSDDDTSAFLVLATARIAGKQH